jgi:hypothetical protein
MNLHSAACRMKCSEGVISNLHVRPYVSRMVNTGTQGGFLGKEGSVTATGIGAGRAREPCGIRRQ